MALKPRDTIRGAGSEVWNRVYMIALVKKFWPSETEYQFSFKTNNGGECRDGKTMSFCYIGFKFSRVQTSRKGFHELF